MQTNKALLCLLMCVAAAAAVRVMPGRTTRPGARAATCMDDKDCDYDNNYCTPQTCDKESCMAAEECSGRGKCWDDDWCECPFGYTGEWCEQHVSTCKMYTLGQPNWWLLMPEAAPNSPGDKCLTCETDDMIYGMGGSDIEYACNGDMAEYWDGEEWQTLPQHMFYAGQHNHIFMSTIQANQEHWRERLEGKYVRLHMSCNNGDEDCVTFIVERTETYWGQFDGPKTETCQIDMRVLSDDGKRFVVSLDITSDRDLKMWEVFFRWPKWEMVDRVWGADIDVWHNDTMKTDFATLTSKPWNGHLAKMQTYHQILGMEGSYSGDEFMAPGEFFLNGKYCTRIERRGADQGFLESNVQVTGAGMLAGIAGVACISALIVLGAVKANSKKTVARPAQQPAQDDGVVLESWATRRTRAASIHSRGSRASTKV